ncbi:unnamed protein product [Rotaria socialis]|uniref:Uncharacterized protein n=1 Tax=Rotaria socialis TaxID=392032 RepID=A0A818BTF2_9BILA|nr:unnamed protein product [Rotaria socialis]CAF4655398.1 unnamed protein product [Rotaria socialis]
MFNKNSSLQRSCLPTNDSRRNSTTGSSRILSPIAFFHDGISRNVVDLRFNMMGPHRRAQAIATAPRRNRNDDDDDHEQKKILFGFIKTSSVPIPIASVTQQTQTVPKNQSDVNLIPSLAGDRPERYSSYEFNYLYRDKLSSNRFSPESLS